MSSTNMKKETKIVLSLLVIVAIIGGYFFPRINQVMLVGNAPAGSTFGSAKIATVIFAPSSATSTSILNTDADDRIVKNAEYYCSGFTSVYNGGVALPSGGLVFRMATTSSVGSIALPTTLGNPNLLLATSVATSTGYDYLASTTPGLTGTVQNRVWASGSYLTIDTSATSTASCVIGVTYNAS